MGGKIFVIQSDDSLQSLIEQEFATEDDFQTLLEKYPDLLPGEQINQASPRRWLLVSREFGVPDTEGGSDRWALDHLFLDQDAIPTLVEVKRKSDARLTGSRREVVGQMLDYAANAVVYWPVEKLRAVFEASFSHVEEANQAIAQLLETPPDTANVDEFWLRVGTNLQAGRIRLIFVADHIPLELQRIIEFLNYHMNLVEVFAVEIRHFVGEDKQGQPLKTLVPQVIGATALTPPKNSGGRLKESWDYEKFFARLAEKHDTQQVEVARSIYEWAKGKMEVAWGSGGRDGSFTLRCNADGKRHSPLSLWTTGHVSMQFQYMKAPPFDEATRLVLLDKCNAISGVNLPKDSINRSPSFMLSALTQPGALTQFLETLDWMLSQVEQPN